MTIGRRHLWLTASGFLAFGLTLLSGFTPIAQSNEGKEKPAETPAPKKTTRQKFMEAKLVLSQGLLQGLVLQDYEALEKNATGMNLLTLAEEWGFNNSKEYIRMSEDLRRISKQLTKAATDKNIDAAALAYQRMTLNCVECHQALRAGFK